MFSSPTEYAKNIGSSKHIVLFYEDIEYSRSITFMFLKSGIEKREHCFYITPKEEEKNFLKKEFKEIMYGPNITYEYNTTPNAKFHESLLHLENVFDLASKESEMRYDLTNNLINTVKRVIQPSSERNNVANNRVSKYNRMVLKCIHKIKTTDEIQNNLLWEKNFRNSLIRKA